MDHWSCILKVPLNHNSQNYYKVAASLCFSSTSKTLTVPSANAIFFNGDRVQGTTNPVIEKLSDLQNIADILVSKFGGSINAWVIEASVFNGPFAVYKDFIPSVNKWGEPKSYCATGFPASSTTVSLLSNCLGEAKKAMSCSEAELHSTSISPPDPKTIILGFSKGGTVLNQLVTEMGSSEPKSMGNAASTVQQGIIPRTAGTLLDSITEVNYIDVGLNSHGAYITDQNVIEKILKRILDGAPALRFVLHGTPRQWCDKGRDWIRDEKEKLVRLLESSASRSNGKLKVCERLYFADKTPDMQMHFEIIEKMNVN